MRVTIRAAHPQDAKAISGLIRENLGLPVSASETAHVLARLCLSPRSRVFCADVDELTVGFLHVSDYDTILMREPLKVITAMAVSGSYRRIGIGTAMLRRAERWASEAGAAGVLLHAGFGRDAEAFFTACGYTAELPGPQFRKTLPLPPNADERR